MLPRIFFWIISWNLISHAKPEEKLEPICYVNGRNVINRVNEKFLSISIDPGVLLAGMNLSEPSLKLAQHLSPAYVKLAGETTDFVTYHDRDFYSNVKDKVAITPSMWFGINEWLILTKLRPIYGIGWEMEGLENLLEISDKLNVSCDWQMGFDSSNRSALQYENAIIKLNHLLSTHPDKDWKIIGSDISKLPDIHLNYIKSLVEAFMWESHNSGPNVKLWTSLRKFGEPITFSSALTFAKEIGNSAKSYEVVFSQPRIFELFRDTPIFWFTFLHKKLMGKEVLEAKSFRNPRQVQVFAHCANSRRISKNGVLTLMIVNENSQDYNTKLITNVRVSERNIKVEEFILTSKDLNSTDVFLNGQLLTPETFNSTVTPKLRQMKATLPIFISSPPHSIGFFVISGINANVCQKDLTQYQNFENHIVKNIGLNMESRSLFGRNIQLDSIAEKLREEMAIDEEYYSNPEVNSRVKVKPGPKTVEQAINTFNDRAKLQRKRLDYQKRKAKLLPRNQEILLELDIEEKPQPDKVLIRKPRDINVPLLERKFGPLDSETLEKIRQRRKPRGINQKLLGSRSRLEESTLRSINKVKEKLRSRRLKRDINLDLLKTKSEKKKVKPVKLGEKEATVRKPGQTSEELLAQLEEEMKSLEEEPPVKTEIFAELASPDSSSEEIIPEKSRLKSLSRKSKKKKDKEIGEDLQFLTSSEEFTDIEEGMPCIHEYFGDKLGLDTTMAKNNKKKHFLREFGEFSEEKPKKKKVTKDDPKSDVSEEDMDLDDGFRRRRSLKEIPQKGLGSLLFPKHSVEYDLSVEPLTNVKKQEILKEQHIGPEDLKDIDEDETNLNHPIFEELNDELLSQMNLHAADAPIIKETAPQTTEKYYTTNPTVTEEIITENYKVIEENDGENDKTNIESTSVPVIQTENETTNQEVISTSKPTKEPIKIGLRGSFVSEEENEIDEKTTENIQSTTNFETTETTTGGKIVAQTISEAPILRLRLLGSEESNDPRHKRDKLHHPTTTSTAKPGNPTGTHRNDIMTRLRELKEKRMNLLQSRHDPGTILTKIQEEETEKVNDFFDQLNAFRERLQKRKNEIDAMILGKKQNKQEAKSKEISSRISNQRSKRSLFGRIHPLTPSLRAKSWHPADVLSLRREAFLGSPNQRPPNDHLIFRNLRNDYGIGRYKRESSDENQLDAVVQKSEEIQKNDAIQEKNEVQNMIQKGGKSNATSTKDILEKEAGILSDFNGFLGNVTGFFKNLSKELRDYAKQLGIFN